MAKEEFLESDRAPACIYSRESEWDFGSRCVYRINEDRDEPYNCSILDMIND